jgi:phosphatidylglycerol:prolipoprotein diacylglycerol transferase
MFLAIQYPSWIHPEIFPGVPFLHFLRWYGLMYLFAFGTAYFAFKKLAHSGFFEPRLNGESAVTDDDIVSFFTWGIVFLLILARVFSVLVYDSWFTYLTKPWLIFWPFSEGCRFTGLAGMSYHGGFAGGLIGLIVWSAKKKRNALRWIDAMAVSAPAGYTWGRLGNFLNGELWGRVTDAPWGVVFPGAKRFSYAIPWVKEIADKAGLAAPADNGLMHLPRHPSQIYEAVFEGAALFLALWFLWKFFSKRGKRPFDGFFACVYTAGYGIARFIIEYFREPDASIGYRIANSTNEPTHLNVSLLNISTGQILCTLMVLASLITLAVLAVRSKRKKQNN